MFYLHVYKYSHVVQCPWMLEEGTDLLKLSHLSSPVLSFFTSVLGMWTQVLLHARQELYWQSSPGLCILIFSPFLPPSLPFFFLIRSHIAQLWNSLCNQGWSWASDPPAFISRRRDYKPAPSCTLYVVLWIKPRGLCTLARPAFCQLSYMPSPLQLNLIQFNFSY